VLKKAEIDVGAGSEGGEFAVEGKGDTPVPMGSNGE
jgi:hypothetical protein